MTYEYHNDRLSVPARLLYEELGLMSYNNYKLKCYRGKLVRTKEGRGADNQAWVSFHDLDTTTKQLIRSNFGEPKDLVVRNQLLQYLAPDMDAISFFANHRRPNGKALTNDDQRKRTTNCIILNAIKTILQSSPLTGKAFGSQKSKIWQNISEAVNAIPTEDSEVNGNFIKGFPHSLPTNDRRLKAKYKEYFPNNYHVFINANEGNDHSVKIKGDVADFLLATYALPTKMSIPMLMQRYNNERLEKDWPELSDSGITHWLYLPEQERRWVIARDGKDVYRRKFGNSISRDKSQWFPNAYWAIDGSKIDWIHYCDDASTKRAAKLKINPLIDVYSEKIIGWSFSESESHFDHITAVNMALNEAQCRPYLLTYDNQSGHKMARMQTLYTEIMARDGGTHFPHKSKQYSNPMEQVFGRLQQQVINQLWFSDKQSVKARMTKNQVNQEFIAENTHKLYTKDQLLKAWEACVHIWNSAEHPLHRGQTRNQVYQHSMPMQEEISILEIASAVWISESNAITYRREGITMRLGENKFLFEVYDHNNDIDLEFRRTSIGKKFIVRYNPEYLDSYVQLYEVQADGSTTFTACAQPKRKHESIPALMTDGDKEAWFKDFKTQQLEYERDKAAMEAVAQRSGITRESIIQEQDLLIKMGGVITKKQRTHAETEYDF